MSAMIAAIDGAYIANQIRMLRQQDPRAVLVVEGPSDELFFERLADETRCRIDIAHGRENALDAFEELCRSAFLGILFIVDADFDVLDGRFPLPFGLLSTDVHDLETMIVASPALDKLLRHTGQREKLAAFQQRHGDLRAHLIVSAAALGRLLRMSLREGLGLRFEELRFARFVNDKTLEVDEVAMVKTVIDHSSKHALHPSAILAALAAAPPAGEDPWQLACGHHLAEILAIGLRKALGSHDAKEMRAETIERELILAYEPSFFAETRLYAAIRAWEALSHPFAVLRASL
jgi:hypothetical protein